MCFFSVLFHRCIQQLLNLGMLQQTLGCLLHCGEMWNGFKAQILDQFRHVNQQRDHTAIVFPLMCFEDQNGEELVLRELPGTESV